MRPDTDLWEPDLGGGRWYLPRSGGLELSGTLSKECPAVRPGADLWGNALGGGRGRTFARRRGREGARTEHPYPSIAGGLGRSIWVLRCLQPSASLLEGLRRALRLSASSCLRASVRFALLAPTYVFAFALLAPTCWRTCAACPLAGPRVAAGVPLSGSPRSQAVSGLFEGKRAT